MIFSDFAFLGLKIIGNSQIFLCVAKHSVRGTTETSRCLVYPTQFLLKILYPLSLAIQASEVNLSCGLFSLAKKAQFNGVFVAKKRSWPGSQNWTWKKFLVARVKLV